jgi:hypothetical protein
VAGRGPAPNPPEQRRRQNAPARGEWIDIPTDARRTAPVPKLPKRADGRTWTRATRDWWTKLWAKPVAIMWDDDDDELLRLAFVREKFWAGLATAADATEMRQIEDRHGLNPKGMRDLRWRLIDSAGIDTAETERATGTTGRRGNPQRARRSRALKLVEGDPST